jgi:hypothetical protein
MATIPLMERAEMVRRDILAQEQRFFAAQISWASWPLVIRELMDRITELEYRLARIARQQGG